MALPQFSTHACEIIRTHCSRLPTCSSCQRPTNAASCWHCTTHEQVLKLCHECRSNIAQSVRDRMGLGYVQDWEDTAREWCSLQRARQLERLQRSQY